MIFITRLRDFYQTDLLALSPYLPIKANSSRPQTAYPAPQRGYRPLPTATAHCLPPTAYRITTPFLLIKGTIIKCSGRMLPRTNTYFLSYM